MDPHAQPSDRPAKVVIDAASKADAPARYARLRELGPIHPAEFHPGLAGWVVVGHDLARAVLTHPALLKDATPAADALDEAGFTAIEAGTWDEAAISALQPVNRIGRPTEVAEAIAWRASPAASFVTGTILNVDGGYKAQ